MDPSTPPDNSAIASAYDAIAERWLDDCFKLDNGVRQHDMCHWTPARRYRFISGWDSLWHIALDQQWPLMLKLMGALEPEGVFIFTAGGLDAADAHVDSAMGPAVLYSTLGIPGLLGVVKEGGCIVRHLEFDQLAHKHVFMVVQREVASSAAPVDRSI